MHPCRIRVVLADPQHISVTEYFGGRAQSQILEEGFLARANHSVFGVVQNVGENSAARYTQMKGSLENLYPQLPNLDRETVIARLGRLRTPREGAANQPLAAPSSIILYLAFISSEAASAQQ